MKIAITLLTVVFYQKLNALTLGPFETIAPGVYDAWEQADPENVNDGEFTAAYGNGKIFLVSERLYRNGFDHPWDPASRGGIVSTLDLSTNTWSHKPYGRLDEDDRGSEIFTLKGVLFMMTYSYDQDNIVYNNLFFWYENDGYWIQIPFDIDPEATAKAANERKHLTVQVPKQDDNIAFVVASVHGYRIDGDADVAFSKLEVDISDGIPTKATLKSLAHQKPKRYTFVAFTAVKNNNLYGFLRNMHSEGYDSDYYAAYGLDLNNNQITDVSFSGPAPSVDYSSENMHQTENEVLIVGGSRAFGIGESETVNKIYALNLNSLQWQESHYAIPKAMGRKTVLDQNGKKLYLIGLEEGVAEAKFESE